MIRKFISDNIEFPKKLVKKLPVSYSEEEGIWIVGDYGKLKADVKIDDSGKIEKIKFGRTVYDYSIVKW